MLKPENICSKKKIQLNGCFWLASFHIFFVDLYGVFLFTFYYLLIRKVIFKPVLIWVIPKLKKLLPCIGNLSDEGDAIQVYVSSHCLPIRSIKVFQSYNQNSMYLLE